MSLNKHRHTYTLHTFFKHPPPFLPPLNPQLTTYHLPTAPTPQKERVGGGKKGERGKGGQEWIGGLGNSEERNGWVESPSLFKKNQKPKIKNDKKKKIQNHNFIKIFFSINFNLKKNGILVLLILQFAHITNHPILTFPPSHPPLSASPTTAKSPSPQKPIFLPISQ